MFASQSSNEVGFYGTVYSLNGGGGFALSDFNGVTRNYSVFEITPEPGVWYHIVGMRTASNEYIVYVNTIPSTNNGSSTLSLTSNQPFIATNPAAPETFYGNMSVLRIYNRSLTQEEVQQNFNALRGRYGV